MQDIHELYERAGILHGHYCPGLAIGVRASAIAIETLGVTDIQSHGLYCVAENSACYLDGIQMTFGATMGKKNLSINNTGEAAFNFYNDDNGKSVRLVLIDFPKKEDRAQTTEYILTAPKEDIFTIAEVTCPHP